MDFWEVGFEPVDLFELVQDWFQKWDIVNTVMNL
jgi:hypothetical protein